MTLTDGRLARAARLFSDELLISIVNRAGRRFPSGAAGDTTSE
jgi:hypothetical protein